MTPLNRDRKIVHILVHGIATDSARKFLVAPWNKQRAMELGQRFHLYSPNWNGYSDPKYQWFGKEAHAQEAAIYRKLALENPRDPAAAKMLEFADTPVPPESGLDPRKRDDMKGQTWKRDDIIMRKIALPALGLIPGPIGRIANGTKKVMDFIETHNPSNGASERLHAEAAPGVDSHGAEEPLVDRELQDKLDMRAKRKEERDLADPEVQAEMTHVRMGARQKALAMEKTHRHPRVHRADTEPLYGADPASYEPPRLAPPLPSTTPAADAVGAPKGPPAWGGAFAAEFPEQYGAGYS